MSKVRRSSKTIRNGYAVSFKLNKVFNYVMSKFVLRNNDNVSFSLCFCVDPKQTEMSLRGHVCCLCHHKQLENVKQFLIAEIPSYRLLYLALFAIIERYVEVYSFCK